MADRWFENRSVKRRMVLNIPIPTYPLVKIELCEADKNTESTQKTATTPQQGLGLNIRDNGNAESAVKNPAENNVQANQSENNAESTTKAESTDPSLGAAIAGGVIGYMAARAIRFLHPRW
ncbi:conserved hypothetical protein [Haemophilus influenzae HK1212]|uniref:Uncharacterized protein n=1 Tax=Haemophilus influenzae HK1212 TaxID=456482 RepID=A0A7G2K1Q3_HAEIF|nr:conserved hypothetical protein [Haemophilus influenzae HK1212]